MTEEQDAVSRLKQGDIAGLEMLVRRHYFKAVRAAYLILCDEAQAEDVVQNCFASLQGKIHQFDSARPFGPWFHRSVVNASLNAVKAQARFSALEENDDEALPVLQALVDRQTDPQEMVEEKELQSAVWTALQQLNPRQRAAIVLRYYLELNETEMVERMRSPASSIKWWLRSARERLRRLLAPVQGELHTHRDDMDQEVRDG
jgi:RNA polymerase sigma-70 factor (ECF subfamily)